ncbi:hypothetical protein C8J56DRAFT_887558 [Mycena floridula]|nr:hypothetical protein C8J56DRAFT_887558 [Mycena floridula]
MSQQHQKSDQIAFDFYTKLFYVVQEAWGDESATRRRKDAARDTARDSREGRRDSVGSAKDKDKGDKGKKTDKWFNLETPDSDVLPKEIRKRYKSISVWCQDASSTVASTSSPSLTVTVLLVVSSAMASARYEQLRRRR